MKNKTDEQISQIIANILWAAGGVLVFGVVFTFVGIAWGLW